MLKLYAANNPGNPFAVSGYVADIQALRGAGFVPASCSYLCVWAKLYEKPNPKAYEPPQRGRFLKLIIVGRRDLLTVAPGDLIYPPGTAPAPTDPPFVVRAAETFPPF